MIIGAASLSGLMSTHKLLISSASRREKEMYIERESYSRKCPPA
jgi:hypothetical protein